MNEHTSFLYIHKIQNTCKVFTALENMVADGMDVSEVEYPALVAAKISGESTT